MVSDNVRRGYRCIRYNLYKICGVKRPIQCCILKNNITGNTQNESIVTMATAVRMSNTTSDSLTTELSRTVVPCALKNNSWLVYNSVYCMRRVRHCHKVCSLFGTVSALQYYYFFYFYLQG